MIRVWYDACKDEERMNVAISSLKVLDAPPAPTVAEFNLGGGISLDFDGDAGWSDETVEIRPESVAYTLLRLAWVAAWHEQKGDRE